MIAIIDNYDSFTYNLVQYVGQLGGEPKVFRNDAVTAAELEAMKPKGLLIGRFDAEPDDDRAGHIVHDMRPSVECMNRLGLVEIWRDDWIWGHWVLQKA